MLAEGENMRILGIDASLSSTGICVLDATFDPKEADLLLEVLLNPTPDLKSSEIVRFNKCLSVVLATQIQPPKPWTKELAKVRKKIRDDIAVGEVSHTDLISVEDMLIRRMEYQVEQICSYHTKLCPVITFIEDYSYHSQGSLVQLAEMKGYLKARKKFNLFTAPIVSVKKVGSTKGNGNKAAMFKGIQRFPLDKFTAVDGNDDEIDALAICLSTFYAIYHRTIGFSFKKGKNSKEKTQIKSWKKCLDTYADHIGNASEMRGLLNAKGF
jgi:Holliday junction resolvasome RuvABC endonuclease subunit